MTEHVLILCGFSYRKNNYNRLIDSAPPGWKFHELNYFKILNASTDNHFSTIIKKYLEDLNIYNVTIIAHSLGGAYAINFAYHYPTMVKNLYLLNTVGIKHKYLLPKFIYLVIKNKKESLIRHIYEDIKGLLNIIKTPLKHLKLLIYVEGINLEEIASKLKVNTVIVWGENDHLLPIRDAKKLRSLIPGSKLIVLKDTGHDWPIHSPELFWKNI